MSAARSPFSIIFQMPENRFQTACSNSRMRDTAREIFTSALQNASIASAFARTCTASAACLRIGDDLHDLDSYVASLRRLHRKGRAHHGRRSGSPGRQQSRGHRRIVGRARQSRFAVSAIFAADIPRPPPNPFTLLAPSSNRWRSRLRIASHLHDLRRRLVDRRKA